MSSFAPHFPYFPSRIPPCLRTLTNPSLGPNLSPILARAASPKPFETQSSWASSGSTPSTSPSEPTVSVGGASRRTDGVRASCTCLLGAVPDPLLPRSSTDLFDLVVIAGSFATTIPVLFGHQSSVLTQLQRLFLCSIALKLIQKCALVLACRVLVFDLLKLRSTLPRQTQLPQPAVQDSCRLSPRHRQYLRSVARTLPRLVDHGRRGLWAHEVGTER